MTVSQYVCVCVCVCAEWICMRASRVTLLSHAKASVEQIGLVGCRDSTHISLNKSACAAAVHVCVSVCECVCALKQTARHAFSQKRLCWALYVSRSECFYICVCECVQGGAQYLVRFEVS